MSERFPKLKPLLTREDMAVIGRTYLTLSEYLDKSEKPVVVTGLPIDTETRRIIPENEPGRTPLSLWEILRELSTKNLRGKSNEICRNNVALAAHLGGTALLELFDRTENKRLPADFTRPISRATGGIQANIEHGLDGAIDSAEARNLIQQSSDLVYSIRFTQPGS